LLKTRNENAEVRLAALDCLDNLVDKLGDDCQTLLQESAPQFFSELLEDDDERVEKKMQETIAKLEQVFGESVQSYFT
jgi:U3 small nucleolar RNA-associated protein 10